MWKYCWLTPILHYVVYIRKNFLESIDLLLCISPQFSSVYEFLSLMTLFSPLLLEEAAAPTNVFPLPEANVFYMPAQWQQSSGFVHNHPLVESGRLFTLHVCSENLTCFLCKKGICLLPLSHLSGPQFFNHVEVFWRNQLSTLYLLIFEN